MKLPLNLFGICFFAAMLFGKPPASSSTHAEGRNYLQYIPATPFVGAEQTSHDYNKFKEPVAPWKARGELPTWDEVMLYKQKLETLREKTREIEDESKPKNPSDASSEIPSKLNLNLTPPPLTWEGSAMQDSTPTQITVSPWFHIPTPQENAPAREEAQPPLKFDPQTEKTPANSTLLLKQPAPGTGDLFIPLPYTSIPGIPIPPQSSPAPASTPATPSSAAIYSQPNPH